MTSARSLPRGAASPRSRWGSRALGGATLVLLLGLASSAQGQRLAVLELHDGAGLGDGAARFLTERLRGVALSLAGGFEIITRENLRALLPPEAELAACERDCEVEVGRKIGAELVISGDITRLGRQLVLSVKLHRSDTARLLAQAHGEAETPEGLAEVAGEVAARLFAGQSGPRPEQVPVQIVGPVGGEVSVDGIPLGTLPLPPQAIGVGVHRFAIAPAWCWQAVEQEVTLGAGGGPSGGARVELWPQAARVPLTLYVYGPDAAPLKVRVAVDDSAYAGPREDSELGEAPGRLEVPRCVRRLRLTASDGREVRLKRVAGEGWPDVRYKTLSADTASVVFGAAPRGVPDGEGGHPVGPEPEALDAHDRSPPGLSPVRFERDTELYVPPRAWTALVVGIAFAAAGSAVLAYGDDKEAYEAGGISLFLGVAFISGFLAGVERRPVGEPRPVPVGHGSPDGQLWGQPW